MAIAPEPRSTPSPKNGSSHKASHCMPQAFDDDQAGPETHVRLGASQGQTNKRQGG